MRLRLTQGYGKTFVHTEYHRWVAAIVGLRKAIYTTNAIESLNSVICKAIKKRKLFPSDRGGATPGSAIVVMAV